MSGHLNGAPTGSRELDPRNSGEVPAHRPAYGHRFGAYFQVRQNRHMDDSRELPRITFAFPGPLRDQLVGAILDGTKTSTTSLVVEYEVEDEAFPQTGSRQVVVDSSNEAVAVIETTDVQHVRLSAVPWEHARDEGEGYSSLSEWRVGHECFWHSAEMRNYLGDATFTVNDDTRLILERFRLVTVL